MKRLNMKRTKKAAEYNAREAWLEERMHLEQIFPHTHPQDTAYEQMVIRGATVILCVALFIGLFVAVACIIWGG